MTVSNKLKISALYAAVFSRAPDKNGLDFWLSQAATSNNVFLDIANGFVQHPVYKQVYDGLSNAAFVNALYVNILGGAGDAGGVAYWTGLLTTQSRAQVLSSFVQSSLEVDLKAGSPAAASLSVADLAAAVIRQNTITNKASVGVSFAELLGTASNLAATTNPATLAGLQSDAAYNASVEAIKNVTHVKSTADNAVANLQAAQASGNPIAYLTNVGQTFTLTASAPSIVEGDAGTSPLVFILTLDKAPTTAVTVNFETLTNGTATAGSDFVANAGTVVFAAGQTVATVTIAVIGDTAFEGNEIVNVRFSGSRLSAPVVSTGTILNDDADPQIALTNTYNSALSAYNTAATAATTVLTNATNANAAYDTAAAAVDSVGSATNAVGLATVSTRAANAAVTAVIAQVTAAAALQAAAAATASTADDIVASSAVAASATAGTAASAAVTAAGADAAAANAEVVEQGFINTYNIALAAYNAAVENSDDALTAADDANAAYDTAALNVNSVGSATAAVGLATVSTNAANDALTAATAQVTAATALQTAAEATDSTADDTLVADVDTDSAAILVFANDAVSDATTDAAAANAEVVEQGLIVTYNSALSAYNTAATAATTALTAAVTANAAYDTAASAVNSLASANAAIALAATSTTAATAAATAATAQVTAAAALQAAATATASTADDTVASSAVTASATAITAANAAVTDAGTDATAANTVAALYAPQSFVLTIGVDGVNTNTDYTGGIGNDVFAAPLVPALGPFLTQILTPTWTSLDVIDGVSGNDTLTIADDSTISGTPVGAKVLNIDTINIANSVASGGVTLDTTTDATNYTGLSALNVTTSGASAIQNLTTGAGVNVVANGLDDITVAGGNNVTATGTTGYIDIYGSVGNIVAASTTGDIDVTNGINVTATSTTGVIDIDFSVGNIVAASTTGDIDVTGGNDVTATSTTGNIDIDGSVGNIVATGTGAVTVNGGNNVTATTTTGSTIGNTTAAVGAVTATATAQAGTNISINGGTTVNVVATDVTTGTTTVGNTTAATGAVTVSSTGNYNGSALTMGAIAVTGGTTVSVTQSAGLTAAEVTAALDNGSNSTVTQAAVSVTGNASTTSVTVNQQAAQLVEQGATAPNNDGRIGVAAGAVTIADVNAGSTTLAGTLSSVSLTNFGASTVNSSALTSVTLGGTGGTFGISRGALTAVPTANTLALNVNTLTGTNTITDLEADNGAGGLDDGFTTINLANTGTSVIANLVAADLTTLNISGSGSLKLTANTLGGALTTAITSTSTGAVTLGGALNVATAYTGGEGVDTITVAATTKAINTGGGDDSVTMSVAVGTGGSVDGGTGVNTLVMTANNAALVSANATFEAGISNFQRLSIDSSSGIISLANLDDINHVTVTGTSGTNDFSGASTGTTLVLTDTSTSNTVSLATNGTADVLNVTLTNAADKNYGTLVATGFDTVNFTVTESGTLVAGTIDTATVTLTNADATTITVAGNANLALTHAGTALTSLDASANQRGGVIFSTAALTGASTLTGGAGVNVLNASLALAGVTINGGDSDDTLTGSAVSSSLLNGGDGDDTLTGGAGADVINGGEGSDTFVFSSGTLITTTGGTGSVTGAVINLSANAITAGEVFTATGGGTIGDFISGVALQSSVASNTATYMFTTESNTNLSIVDTLISIENVTGSTGADYIVGSAGDNVIDGGAGVDIIIGGDGDDTIIATGTANAATDIMDGGAGANSILVSGTTVFAAVDANITNIQTINIAAGTTAGVTITGQTEDFTINGSELANVIVGGSGDDIISGGAGADVLTGGTGADTFVFAPSDSSVASAMGVSKAVYGNGVDVINDFTVNQGDVIIAAQTNTGNQAFALSNSNPNYGLGFNATISAGGDVTVSQFTPVSGTLDAGMKSFYIRGDFVSGEFTYSGTGSDYLLFQDDIDAGEVATILSGSTTVITLTGGITEGLILDNPNF